VLHIGVSEVAGLPADVPTIVEGFSPEDLLRAVHLLLHPGPVLRVAS